MESSGRKIAHAAGGNIDMLALKAKGKKQAKGKRWESTSLPKKMAVVWLDGARQHVDRLVTE
jgi:hypothetical protein